jgi:hypothetical protein
MNVTIFTEPGTGLRMRTDKWYAISDSGSSYSADGWYDPANLQSVMLAFKNEYGLEPKDITIHAAPAEDPADPFDGGSNMCNIVRGDVMLAFWKTQGVEL